MIRNRLSSTVSLAALAALLVAAPSASAQQRRPQQDKAGETIALDEVTVTARKFEELAKDVPMSVTAVTGADLANTVADAPNSLTRQVPNLHYSNIGDPTQSNFSIRGMGALLRPLNSIDSTVGVTYDGVPTSLMGAGIQPLDIRDVEVLRGPQGTLYGRGTLAGAINYISNEPDGTYEVLGRAEIGSHGYRLGEMTVGGTLVPDRVFGRASLRFSNFGGDIRNGIIGGRDGDQKLSAGKGAVRFTNGAGTTITIGGFYNNEKTNIPQFVLRGMAGFPVSGTDIRQKADREIAGGHVTIVHDFDFARFTSVSGYQHVDAVNLADSTDSFLYSRFLGGTPAFWANPLQDKGRLHQRENVFSQELRLNSHEGSAIKWVAGLSYFRSDYAIERNMKSSFSPLANGDFNTDIATNTFGAFGEASVPIVDKLTLTTGLRLAHDDQTMKGRYVANGSMPGVPFFNQSDSYDDTYLTGRASLSYAWTEKLMTYASISRGHSSGGFEIFNTNAPLGRAEKPFEAATSWSYEAGVKYSSLDGRFDASGAVFFNDVKNGPTFNYNPATATFAFMPYDYQTKGFELEGRAALTDWLKLRAGVGYTHARIVNVPLTDAAGVRSGNVVPNIPDWTGNLSLDARYPVTLGRFSARLIGRAEYQYVGSRASDPVNNTRLKSYSIINLTAGVEKDNVSVYGFARNLLDKRYEAFASYLTPQAIGVVVGQGRTIGMGMTVKLN